MEKRRNVEYEAEALQLQEKLEKAKARTKIYEEYDKQSIKDETAADNQNVGKNLNQYYPQKLLNISLRCLHLMQMLNLFI